VRQLAEHYHKSPDLISEEELRQYFLNQKDFCERRVQDPGVLLNLPSPDRLRADTCYAGTK